MDTIDATITKVFETPARRLAFTRLLTLTAANHQAAADSSSHPEVVRISTRMARQADEAARWTQPPDFTEIGLSARLIAFDAARRVLGLTHRDALAMARHDDEARGNTHFLTQD